MEKNSIRIKGKEYRLDKFGFLDSPDQWDEDFAEGIARKLGIYDGLTEEHWKFIRYLRAKFLDEETVPLVVHACAENKLRLNRLMALFPTGYFRGACKIAGISFAFMAATNMWITYENIVPVEAERKAEEERKAEKELKAEEERKAEEKRKVEEEYKVTMLGFLEDFAGWSERFAHYVTRDWNLPEGLTERHWIVIRFLRDFYVTTRTIPTIYETCKTNNVSLEEFGKLFPRGYRRGACRAAGLPFLA
ncbi:MAG: TusE/DsrC/DsvC family sulfur relay protein [Planctomycetota bacterium]|nr:MAG: TusE/DsrC/DsvC family sulfur relay protein [Planctomycetota bacterium]